MQQNAFLENQRRCTNFFEKKGKSGVKRDKRRKKGQFYAVLRVDSA